MPTKKKTRLFTKVINGESVTQAAYSEADVVRYTFDGWREVTEAPADTASEPAKKTAAKAESKNTR